MRIRIILSGLLVLMCSVASAQDVIETLDGKKIEAKIIEITDTEISYKKAAVPEGPVYKTKISNLKSVTYWNGYVEKYNEDESPVSTESPEDTIESLVTPAIVPAVVSTASSSTDEQIIDPEEKVKMFVFMPAEAATFGFYGASIKNGKGGGFFWGFRSDFFPVSNTVGGSWSKESELDPPDGTTYAFDSARSRTSLTFGSLIRLSDDWLFTYVAAGFGTYMHYDLFDQWERRNGNWEWEEKKWILNMDKTIIGVEFEGGLLFDFGVVLTAGFTSTNFQKFGWSMGVGWSY